MKEIVLELYVGGTQRTAFFVKHFRMGGNI